MSHLGGQYYSCSYLFVLFICHLMSQDAKPMFQTSGLHYSLTSWQEGNASLEVDMDCLFVAVKGSVLNTSC